MIENFSTSCREVFTKRRIDRRQFLIEPVKLPIDILFSVGKQTRTRRIYEPFDDARQHTFETRKEIGKREIVLFHGACVLRFDDSKTLPVEYRRHRAIQDPVYFAVLGKVCDLGTTTEITDSRKKIILNNRSKHHTGT